MTTDNRTNEELATRLRQIAESQLMDFDSPHIAMTLNEAAGRLVAVAGTAPQAERDDSPTPGKRLAPEFRADIIEAARDRIQSVWADVPEGVDALTLAQNIVSAQEFFWLSRQFPVLPSSTVDEVEAFKTWHEGWWKNAPNPIMRANAQTAFFAGWDAREAAGKEPGR